MIGLTIIVAIVILLWLKNKQENRAIDRHNKLVDKQNELLEMIKEKSKNEDEN